MTQYSVLTKKKVMTCEDCGCDVVRQSHWDSEVARNIHEFICSGCGACVLTLTGASRRRIGRA